MEIEYFGLSAFRLKGKGATVVTDPYGRDTGLKLPKLAAEIVTVSHDHFDHNFVKAVSGTAKRNQPLVVRAPGEYEAEGVSVYGYASWHDPKQGAERGKNTLFVIYIDGVRVAHLGDLGHILTDKQLEALGKVDVLLLPVGGMYTIGVKEAVKLTQAISPSLVIPMHYQIPGLVKTFEGLAGVEEWVGAVGEVKRLDKLVVDKESLPESTEPVVLHYG
jgi:L-ascorbate metabolism protein UlaG (beta-lactamase superfamily)